MTAKVFYRDSLNTEKTVKNLGWLLNHRHEVTSLSFVTREFLARVGATYGEIPSELTDPDGWLVADLYVTGPYGTVVKATYQTAYNSLDICKDFVAARRAWKHIPLEIVR